jgi:hypothetical protein
MAKALTTIDTKLVEVVKMHALDLLKQVFTEARDRGVAPTKERGPSLFPHGVDLIRVKFELALSEFAKAAVEVEIAGPKPSSASGGA